MSSNMLKNIHLHNKPIANSSSIKLIMISSFTTKNNLIPLMFKDSTNSLILPNKNFNNSIILSLPLPIPNNFFKLLILHMIPLIGLKNIFHQQLKILEVTMLDIFLLLYNSYNSGSIEKNNKMIHGLLYPNSKLLIVVQIAGQENNHIKFSNT